MIAPLKSRIDIDIFDLAVVLNKTSKKKFVCECNINTGTDQPVCNLVPRLW